MMRAIKQTFSRTGIMLICTLTLIACQSMTPRGGSVSDNINKSLEDSTQQQAALRSKPITPPPEVSAALLPPLNVELSGVSQAPVERRFDITVNRAHARSFFMSLAKDTPYNMVVHPSVKGKITLSLKNVTVAEVMETARNVYGYEYRRMTTGFEVLPAKLQSRLFKLDYLNVKRSGMSNVRVSSGQVSSERNGDSSSDNNNDSNSSSSNRGGSVSGSQVSTQSDSDFWQELSVALGAIVGNEEGRQVVINPQSGILVVRAMPAELRAVADYLKATQAVIERQVILEAKILEVELNDGFQSGINWSAMATDNSTGDSIIAGQFGGSSVFPTGVSNLAGQTDALNPTALAGIRSDVASAFGGIWLVLLGGLAVFRRLWRRQG